MGRLKGVPHVISPDILHLLAITGHGDEIVLADINFPTHSICSAPGGPKEYRADGMSMGTLLDAILALMPLDTHSDYQIALMLRTDGDSFKVSVDHWKDFQRICNDNSDRMVSVEYLERFQFYERAKKAYAIIHTGETLPYSNILLKRGVC